MSAQILKSVVPAITAEIFRIKEATHSPQTCAIAALAMYNMMTSFTREDNLTLIQLFELAELNIKAANSRNNDLKAMHYVDQPLNLIGLAKHLGYLVSNKETGLVTMSDYWVELTTPKATCMPFVAPVSEDVRRKPYIKGGKVKPSKLMTECIEFLQDTSYHVDAAMVSIIRQVVDNKLMRGADLPLAIQQEQHVWNACCKLSLEDSLYSEYFADNRGRLYHVACAGPNPQSSDFSRSLYSLNVSSIVAKDSAAYQMFMAELEDISGGDWASPKMLSRVAANPVGALEHILGLHSELQPKKPFTYVRLALDWNEFETTGFCDSRVGFGLDAKCSGTQYLAFVAGSMEMAQATGLVVDGKSSDPYQRSLVQLMSILDKEAVGTIDISEDARNLWLNPKTGRNFIKTPYMAIQYGGGVDALVGSSDFTKYATGKLGIPEEKIAVFAEICISAIHRALGDRINLFIEKTGEAVALKCQNEGKPYFAYRHTDGQLVLKPCYPKREVCEPFSIRVDAQTRVIFGQQAENKPWTIRETMPTVEEFVRTFVVNYIQGMDALVARTVAKYAKRAGLRGFTSIHDCFRCCLADAPLMMDVIREAYCEIFVDNNQFEHLSKQVGGISMFSQNIVTRELLMSSGAYYFCQ